MADLSVSGQEAAAGAPAEGPAIGLGQPAVRVWFSSVVFRVLVFTLLAVGLAVRVLPLVQGRELLVRQPSEDGYLLLTVARNLAIGHGMSTADGTMPTNGVQPLVTFVFAGCFALVGGDKDLGVGLVMATSVLLALLALLAVWRLGRVVFATTPDGDRLALLGAALWFAAPVVVAHSMNALETGLYYLVIALTLRYFLVHAVDASRDLPWPKVIALGALLGLAFWARNDAIFLIAALGGSRLWLSLVQPATRTVPVLGRRALEAAVMGLVAGIVALPWMAFNLRNFGSIVPVSGHAQSRGPLGQNLTLLPAKLTEFLSITGAIPQPIETHPLVQLLGTALIVTALVIGARSCWRSTPVVRAAFALTALHALLLASYYGVYFGAPHFLSRYTSPLSIMFAFFSLAVVMHALAPPRPALLRTGALAALTLVAVALDLRQYRNGHQHMHFQVVEWVNRNVPREVWVGAVQTGTLGFFHDRTINLDGKTNPAALKAQGPEKMRPYLLSTPIRYLADWEGIAAWVSFMAPEFRVLVKDPQRNLAVLQRTTELK